MKTKELIRVGQMMSNVCFNLSQSDLVPESFKGVMRTLQKEWGVALRASRPPPRPKKSKKVKP